MTEETKVARDYVDVTTEHLCTTAEAVRLVKRSERVGARWCLSVRLDAAIVGKPEHVFQDALSSYLNLSRSEALRLVRSLLHEAVEGKGGRIKVRECLTGFAGQLRTTYWIG